MVCPDDAFSQAYSYNSDKQTALKDSINKAGYISAKDTDKQSRHVHAIRAHKALSYARAIKKR
jgi:hypothetical protein